MTKRNFTMMVQRVAASIRCAVDEVVATNQSFYYTDAAERTANATVSVDKHTGVLSLTIKSNDVRFTPFGEKKSREVLFEGNLGTITKPKLNTISSVMKKYGYGGAGMTAPFKKQWISSFGRKASLKDILEDYRQRTASRQAAIELAQVARTLVAAEWKVKKIYHPTATFLVLRWEADFPRGRFSKEGASEAVAEILKESKSDISNVQSKSSIIIKNPGERNLRVDEHGNRVYFDVLHRGEMDGPVYAGERESPRL